MWFVLLCIVQSIPAQRTAPEAWAPPTPRKAPIATPNVAVVPKHAKVIGTAPLVSSPATFGALSFGKAPKAGKAHPLPSPPPMIVSDFWWLPPPPPTCTESAIGCYGNHIRHCLFAGMLIDNAPIVRLCSHGCTTCPAGTPDACVTDRYDTDICTAMSDAHRAPRTCSAFDDQSVGCFGGPDIGYCYGGTLYLVDYCGTAGCVGSAIPGECNAGGGAGWFPDANPVIPSPENDLCIDNVLYCGSGHIRLCFAGLPRIFAPIVHDCRNLGCSQCSDGPDVCNDQNWKNACPRITPALQFHPCTPANRVTESYCDGSNMRHCDPSNRGIIVELCGPRKCTNTQCNAGQAPVAPTPGWMMPTPGWTMPTPGWTMPTPGWNPDWNPPTPKPIAPRDQPTPGGGGFGRCGPRVRREWGSLPESERTQYVSALNQLYSRGDMERLAQFHYDNRDTVHGAGVVLFLLWHRVLLFDFEEKLRALPGCECMTIPYWNYDYSSDAVARAHRRSVFGNTPSRLGQGDRADCIGPPFAQVTHAFEGPRGCIRRNPDFARATSLKNSVFADLLQIGESDFNTFAQNLQNQHGIPHIAFGGIFSTHYSPFDPLFMLHHGNIDRFWDIWQDCHNDWTWPEGMQAFVPGYPGVSAGDFMDHSKTRWQGRTEAVSYAPDQFSDPSVYSSNWRQDIATRCTDGRLRRQDSPNPLLGVDSGWAIQPVFLSTLRSTRTLVPILRSVPCSSSTGVKDFSKLTPVTTPVEVHDGWIFVECMARCSTFYFKGEGEGNCVCITTAPKPPPVQRSVDSPLPPPLFKPECKNAQTTYGFYENVNTKSRRLLQEPDQPAAPKTCFDAVQGPRNITAVACSSAATTPPPLSSAWIQMNHLDPKAPALCAAFTPASGFSTIDCVNT